jgi:uncharacterized protein
VLERLSDYHHKLLILRQIMSNQAGRNRTVNTAANIATVVVASTLTFMGFAGLDNVHRYVGLVLVAQRDSVELVFNLLILMLFILVVLHLVFRFSDRQAKAEQAVVTLTQLLNRIDDVLQSAQHGYVVDPAAVGAIRDQYDVVIRSVPANSDREFLRAKKDFQKKQIKKASLDLSAQSLFEIAHQERIVKAVILRSDLMMRILRVMRDVDHKLYLGGGLVRNAVWDFLHGYKEPTPVDDVDVIYFDQLADRKEHDTALEQELTHRIPNLRWSVKNQARMHVSNDDEAYTSLADAVSKWPETATAVVVRLSAEGELELSAPHGYSDLFRLVVQPTPHFRNKMDAYRERIRRKEWSKVWQHLLIVQD